jgi:hypothetical protein
MILTTDLQALNYVLNAPEFEKSHADRVVLGELVGKGWFKFLVICIVCST